MRIGFTTTSRPGVEVSAESVAAVDGATRLLEGLGHLVEPFEFRVDWDAIMPAFGILSGTNVAAAVAERARTLGRDPTTDDIEYLTWTQCAMAATRGAIDYVDAVRTMHRVSREVAANFTAIDVLMTPTVGVPPPLIGHISMMEEDLRVYGAKAALVSSFLGIFNITGQPAMSVPLHTTAHGLPLGVQFATALGGEPLLFTLAGQLERAAPWWNRRPPS